MRRRKPGCVHKSFARIGKLATLATFCLFHSLYVTADEVRVAGKSPVADAAEKSDHASVFRLLELSDDVNAQQVDGMTALHWAAHNDDLALAKRLIEAGANVRLQNRYGIGPLSMACTNGNSKIVELLLEAGADPNATLRGGETVLMTAARTGRIDSVKALLAKGASIAAKDRNGQSAIMWAAADGHAAVVKVLIDAGADLKTPLRSGFTPLFLAVREGRQDVVRLLLQSGADVNEVMKPVQRTSGKAPVTGTSPLILAVENGHFELAAMLLEAGADPNDQRSGFTALHTLSWVRKPNRGDGDDGDPPPIGSGSLSSLQFAKELVKHGATVNERLSRGESGRGIISKVGATPFLLASVTADVPFMRTLLELGADPLMPNSQQCTPLMAAAGIGTRAPGEEAGTEPEAIEAIKLILQHRGDVNTVDDNGETAMHGAAYKSFPGVVRLLHEQGRSN